MSSIGRVWLWPVRHDRMTVVRRALSRDAKARATGAVRRRFEEPRGVRHHLCQWIEGAPSRAALFCDAPVIAGRSWCALHMARVFEPPKDDR